MYFLKTTASFDSAHFLSGYDGKCANIHGHRWVIEVTVNGDKLHEYGVKKGMLMDFGEVKDAVKELASKFDHTLIYEKNSFKPETVVALKNENFNITEVPFRPTAENFAKYFFDFLKETNLPVISVAVYETPENCAVYRNRIRRLFK